MIVTELFRYYERLRDAGELPPYGFSAEKVTGCVVLHPDGGVFTVEDMRQDVTVGKKTVQRPSLLDVPQPPRRTVAILPGFLCDSAAYLFGVADGSKRARALEQFAASRARHETVLAGIDHPAARAVLDFFRTWEPGREPPASDPEVLSGWLVFRLRNEEDFVHDLPDIRAAWERTLLAEEEGAVTGQCLATGEEGQPIARIHPAVKGVPGAQTAGAALVSFNDDAYTSYGKTQNFNAPMSTRVAHGYTAALNHLLAQRGKRHIVVGEVSVLFWTDRPTRFEEDVGLVFGRPDAQTEDSGLAEEIRAALDRLAKGRDGVFPEDRSARFFVLGLSGNAARVAVRFWVADGLGAMADRLADHFRDLDLVTQWDNQPRRPTVWALANETKAKYRRDGDHARPDPNDKGLAKLQGDLLRAVLSGGPYPASLLAVLLDRIRADHTINHPRMALLKAVLVRRRRLAGLGQEGESLVSLDPNRTDIGYRLGRLFAVLERIQQAAADGRDLNATIRDKYIGSASSTPRSAFPFLLDLTQKHLKKVRGGKPGLARVLDVALQDIQEPLTGFPATLDLEQRGLFFLGYYHERADRKAGKAVPDTGLDTAASVEPTPASE
ncbi:type I-C CRISPR-associated protein Cas8c/Csd1 [Azospirillum soli]|uniref:type I-C CRISPR-associated protein Cas8c/Csd1 n=1 Tax=Azospirillum soli TaxID=1304799 RepID=UPI001AE30723|nr:type I-C CRISPR-associated protein Cas8c/Csd1 [Azospirillum soli]MBP2316280.1 CRISPR-associated protein Csd1 [Azospirillum soli]